MVASALTNGKDRPVSRDTLTRHNRELRRALAAARAEGDEARQTLDAIRSGAVDAVVVSGAQGEQVFTLRGAERSYRLLVETVNAGALTVTLHGMVQYANGQAAALLGVPLERLIGSAFARFIPPADRPAFQALFAQALAGEAAGEVQLRTARRRPVSVHLALRRLDEPERSVVCLVVTDLTERRQAEAALRRANAELEVRVAERTAALVEDIRQREQAEAALRASEERYRLAIQATNEALWDLDLTSGAVHWNERYDEAFGRPPETANSWSWWIEHIHPEDRDRTVAGLRGAIAGPGTIWTGEYRFLRVDGVWADILDRAYIARDAAGTAWRVVGTMEDQTDRKRAEAALRAALRQAEEGDRLLRALMDYVPEGIIIADAPDGARRRVSRYGARLLGSGPTDTTAAQTVDECHVFQADGATPMAPEDLPVVRALRGEVVTGVEMVRQNAKGEWLSLLCNAGPIVGADGAVVAGIVAWRDISDRKQADNALRESQQRLAWVLDTTGVGLWLNPLPLGRLNWDPRTRELFFLPPGVEPTIELFWERLHPDDREPTRLAVDAALRNHALYAIDHRVVSPVTGEVRWIRSVGQGTYAVDGRPLRFDGINYDITERKQAEAQLQAALADRNGMLATNQTLLREVHHRVKNNLQMLCDMLFLQMEGMADEEQTGALRDTYGRIYAIARLHELLHESMHSGQVRLSDYLGELASGLQTFYPNTAFRIGMPLEPVYLDVDRAIHTGLIANELITNAVKHAFPDGRRGEVSLRLQRMGEQVELQVRDTGKGVPEDLNLEQAKGLGLRIVRILAKRLEASVQIENTNGACFSIRFPLAAEAPREPQLA